VTPEQVRNDIPLVEALQYETIYYARHGVDCLALEGTQALESEIDAILGGG
jgi:hypothetical protein